MRVPVVAPVWFPVPPTGYGGIEWVVWLLADGLVDAGHDVTLFAAGDSHSRAKPDFVYDEAPGDEFDLINDHTGIMAAAIGGSLRTPVAHTVHGPLDGFPGVLYEHIGTVAPN